MSNHNTKELNGTLSMQEWFEKAPPEQRDTMTALQLDYRFERDNLSGMWWKIFQELGFQHDGVKYELPGSAPASARKEYDGMEIYEHLDRFAIPQLTSAFQEFPERPESYMTKEQVDWWRDTREEMIFRKFRIDIEKNVVRRKQRKTTKGKQTSLLKNNKAKRKSAPSSHDPGADLFMKRSRKGGSKKKGAENSEIDQNVDIVFPTIQKYAEMAQTFNIEEAEGREDSYVSSFENWRFLSSMNQSLLFYGVGSKRHLLNRFAKEELEKDGDVLIIDGFDEDVTIQGILQLIVHHWLGGKEPGHNRYDVNVGLNSGAYGSQMYALRGDASTVQKSIAIAYALAQRVPSNSMRALYLVLHNIDGIALRNPTAQEALAGLVSSSTTPCGLNSLRLVASVDHVNGPALLWDSLTSNRFRWDWIQMHTHRPYILELTESKISDGLPKSSSRKRIAENEDATEESVFNVLASLAPRITEVLKQLASLQLDTGEDWIDHTDLLKKCQLKMCVNTDSQLRVYLRELCDHGIVASEYGSPLTYRIPYSEIKLNQILNYQR